MSGECFGCGAQGGECHCESKSSPLLAEAARADREGLTEKLRALKPYLQHKADCAVSKQGRLRPHSHGEHDFVDPPRWPCDCGLDELSSALAGIARPAQEEAEPPKVGDVIEAGARLEAELRAHCPAIPRASFTLRQVMEKHLGQAMRQFAGTAEAARPTRDGETARDVEKQEALCEALWAFARENQRDFMAGDYDCRQQDGTQLKLGRVRLALQRIMGIFGYSVTEIQ